MKPGNEVPDAPEETLEQEVIRLRRELALMHLTKERQTEDAITAREQLAIEYLCLAEEQYRRSKKMCQSAQYLFGFAALITLYWAINTVNKLWG